MPDTVLIYTSLSLLLLCLVVLVVLWLKLSNTTAKLMQSVGLIDKLYALSQAQSQEISDLNKALNASTGQQSKIEAKVSQSVEEFEAKLNTLEATVDRLEEQDPNLKMYSKASKLVEQGADMHDIIEASGLPRAEVEVLISLHARK